MKNWLLIILLFCFRNLALGQIYDLELPKGARVDIPFDYENDFIIVKVLFNGTLPLRFILDTGAEHTILTKRAVTDLFNIQYDRKFTIYGSDLSTALYAYLARGITLKIDKMVATNRNILVLEEDYFRFEEFAGINVQGIMGSDVFRRFVVKINFQKRIISFIDPNTFSAPDNSYEKIPIILNRYKPYLDAKIMVDQQEEGVPARLLIDTGASLSLLLYTNTDLNIHLPSKVIRTNIGMGLGGFLQGALGRVQTLAFEPFAFNGVLSNFQEVSVSMDTIQLFERHGILGNHILKRFTIYIDYIRGNLYLKPNREYRAKFNYDRSGISLAASGPALNKFNVINLVDDSPAAEAGVQVGDEVRRINGWPANFFTLQEITNKLQGRKGKRIKLVLVREGETIRCEFRLRDLI